MVFEKQDNIYVDCHCGCDEGLRIIIDEEDPYDLYFIVTLTSGNFYKEQENWRDRFKLKCKKIWSIIRNKDFHYSEICMTKEEFEEFRTVINNVGKENIN